MGKTRSPQYPGRGMAPKFTNTATLGGIGYCDEHAKALFPSRVQAKKFMASRFPGEKMNAYRCAEREWLWHIGHLSPAAKRGLATRDGVHWRSP